MNEQTDKLEQRKVPITIGQLARIQERTGEWVRMQEHWNQYSLDRNAQLDLARQYCAEILAIITPLYRQNLTESERCALTE